MSATTFDQAALTGSHRERGFLSRLGARVVASRKAQADRAVAAYLLSLDDKTLATLGHDRETLRARYPQGYPFL